MEEIAEYLNLYDADPNQISQTRLLLHKVETSIAELEGKQRDIVAALGDLGDIRTHCIQLLKARE